MKKNAKAKAIPLDDPKGWVPILRGKIYCSPRCGGNCTLAAFQAATVAAEKLAKRLGPGWTPDVWENVGWHYKVVSPCRRLKLHGPYSARDCYMAFFGDKDMESGGTYAESGNTPTEAISATIETAAADFATMDGTFKPVQYLGGPPVRGIIQERAGVLVRDGEVLSCAEADAIAERTGFVCAERLVKHMANNVIINTQGAFAKIGRPAASIKWPKRTGGG